MKALLFCFILLGSAAAWAQVPGPPGLQQADQASRQAQQNIPPPTYKRAPLDVAKLRQEANELATLAQAIPTDVDQSSKGILPKDLEQRLKRIEKLAKHLRGELTP